MAVLLTDGNQYGNFDTHLANEGIALATEQNLSFYVFGIGFGVDPHYLSQVGEQTRGQSYFYPDTSTLTSAYDYLSIYLRTNYVITVDTTLEPDGSAAPITVSVGDQSATTDYVTPDRYPRLSIEGLPEGALSEPVTIAVQVQTPQGLGTNTVTVDGNPLDVEFASVDENTVRAEITLDPYAYAPGEHVLTLSAVDSQGGQRELEGTFSVEDLPPVVSIGGLDEAAFVTSGEVPIEVQVTQAQQPIEQVVIQVDGNTVAQLDTPPYTTTLNTLQAGPGQHTLSVTVVDPSGGTLIARSFEVDPALFVTPTATPTATFTPTSTPTATNTPLPTGDVHAGTDRYRYARPITDTGCVGYRAAVGADPNGHRDPLDRDAKRHAAAHRDARADRDGNSPTDRHAGCIRHGAAAGDDPNGHRDALDGRSYRYAPSDQDTAGDLHAAAHRDRHRGTDRDAGFVRHRSAVGDAPDGHRDSLDRHAKRDAHGNRHAAAHRYRGADQYRDGHGYADG